MDSGKQPSEWDIRRLGFSRRKAILRGQKDRLEHRGVSSTSICEELDHESQCGFRPERGTAGATFSLKLALEKRREHGLETWVVFVDFVKALGRVPRELLWQTLAKFGVPRSAQAQRCPSWSHQLEVHFSVSGAEASINSSAIGIRKSDA